jgi:hypothetical protein
MVEMVVRIVASGVMTNPAISIGVNVRRLGVAGLVAKSAMLITVLLGDGVRCAA